MPTCFVYILRCSDNSLYTGIAANLQSREQRHQEGTACNYTKIRRPIQLVYAEIFPSRKEAAQRERQIKRWTKEKKERLINGLHPNKNKSL